ATVHELPFVENSSLEGTRRELAQSFRLARALSSCALLFAPSEATLRQMRSVHPAAGRITRVVPHPCPAVRGGATVPHDGSLLFVGRLGRRKRVEALFSGAAAFDGEIRLAGPQRRRERARVEAAARRFGVGGRVRFLGIVDEDALDALYRSARAVALLSASEGFGFPVLEALARGVPVIVAEGTGAAETGGDAALVVDPASPEAIAEAIRRAGDAAYRAGVETDGPARCALFSPERTARAYEEAFLHAVGG
ncbi:MAG: glycosyltransferase, partial [Planctomycetota bacterium]